MAYLKLLITGANGCVGRYLTDWFLENTSFKLYLMVRDPKKLPLSIKSNKKINLLVSDIRNCKQFKDEISKINYVIHTATAWGDPKRAYEVNIIAFEQLLGLLDEKKLKKIIYFSTASILDEKTELMRESLIYGTEYIQTKYQCYEWLRGSDFSKKTYVIFPTLVFGGTLDKKSEYPASYLTQGLKQAQRWLWIARFFRIDSKFHFIHARDIAQICGSLLKKVIEGKDEGFKNFVVGQNYITIDEAINILLKNSGMKRYFSIPLKKRIIKILLKVLPIQATSWDTFSIKKYNFNHKPITTPESLGVKSYAKTLRKVIRLAKLPRCNIN